MPTVVVNIRLDKYDVYIGRAGKGMDGYFGNPFPLQMSDPRGSTIARYKRWFWDKVNSDVVFEQKVKELRGKRLGCFCKPLACHGDVIVDWLNAGCPLKE